MSVSVAAVMRQCNNHFVDSYVDGTFRIANNVLEGIDQCSLSRFVYISGSLYHDGVWEICFGCLTGHSVEGLRDETFEGRVWMLAPPADFLDLCKEISEFDEKNPIGAYASESFGEYSYTRTGNGIIGWKSAFADRLSRYRKMFTEV